MEFGLVDFNMHIPRLAIAGGLLAAACFLWSPAFSQNSTNQTSEVDFANAHVRRLIGMAVENHDGARLGLIRDLVVDFHTGKITYAIVSTSGFLGVRPQLRAVPPQALSTATVKARTVALDISKIRWTDAPQFKKKDLQALAERTQEVLIYGYYGVPVPAQKASKSAAQRPKGQLQFATAVMGAKVAGRDSNSLGKISDLLLDLTAQRPAMAVISAAEPPAKKKNYAVSLRSLSLASPGQITMDATPGMFEKAEAFTPQMWISASTTEKTIYRCE